MLSKKAVLAAVGDELLSGARAEANCTWLANYLNNAGWEVEQIEIISDLEFKIKNLLNHWIGRVDLLVMSGGLGPTHDDRTRDAIAAYLNCSLRPSDLYNKILARYNDPSSPEYNLARFKRLDACKDTQAMIPESAEAVYNPTGSALGIVFKRDGTRVISLPGVPMEYRAMARQELPEIFEPSQTVKSLSSIIIGMPEVEIVNKIPEVINNKALHVSVLPSFPTVELIVRGETSDAEAADALIRSRFDDILPKGAKNLQEAILLQAKLNNKLVACAESCTGGLVQAALTEVPGSSEVFAGGVVSYSNQAKINILGVKPEIIDEFGAVSSECAEAMALGALKLFNADFAVSITGIAGPDGGSDLKPVGTVWFGLAVKNNNNCECRTFCRKLPGERGEVRLRAVRHALAALWRSIRDNRPNVNINF